ncbi:MAG: guanylate kinase [SAR202 cluster bacterium Casp-Chloro-G3]|nr:MAG: guanylate kinase [SAR202 cluster bacterium Casp-Chloro-G3]
MVDIPELNPAPPLLVVLSGPSGVGKDAALDGLKRLDRPWHFAITATTRPPRSGEQDGVDYIFLDTETFLKMKDRDQFLECAEVYGKWYGVPRSQVRQALKNGKDVILKIDVQGAATVRKLAPEALSLFMLPASYAELRSRLNGRMSESAPDLELRLQTAQEELAQVSQFDYRVINRDGGLEQAIADIDAIIAAEKCRVVPRVVQFL